VLAVVGRLESLLLPQRDTMHSDEGGAPARSRSSCWVSSVVSPQERQPARNARPVWWLPHGANGSRSRTTGRIGGFTLAGTCRRASVMHGRRRSCVSEDRHRPSGRSARTWRAVGRTRSLGLAPRLESPPSGPEPTYLRRAGRSCRRKAEDIAQGSSPGCCREPAASVEVTDRRGPARRYRWSCTTWSGSAEDVLFAPYHRPLPVWSGVTKSAAAQQERRTRRHDAGQVAPDRRRTRRGGAATREARWTRKFESPGHAEWRHSSGNRGGARW
jgi:hypothetical protein